MSNTEAGTFGWHFVGEALRDGRPVPDDGEWLEHDGPVVLCESGYHGSERPIDALHYAPAAPRYICWCEFGGEVVRVDDKLAAGRRRIIWRVEAEPILRAFARWCALSVVHLWDAPAGRREYLETGNEEWRVAAGAARAAARAAAWDAVWRAIYSDARAAAGAARAAARAAAWDAARDAQNETLIVMVTAAHKESAG